MVSTLNIVKVFILIALIGGLYWFLQKRWTEYNRVLTSTKKPTNREFKNILKISALGVAAIGLIGALVNFIALSLS